MVGIKLVRVIGVPVEIIVSMDIWMVEGCSKRAECKRRKVGDGRGVRRVEVTH